MIETVQTCDGCGRSRSLTPARIGRERQEVSTTHAGWRQVPEDDSDGPWCCPDCVRKVIVLIRRGLGDVSTEA